MADIVKIDYVEMAERMIIGISKSVTGFAGSDLWKLYFEGGFSEKLGEMEDYQCDDMAEDYIGLGYATDFKDDKSLGNEYIVGRYFKLGTPVPENMISRTIPQGVIVKAQIRGKNIDDIIYNSYILINDMVQKNGYQLDYNNFYWSEVYTYERYCNPAEMGKEELVLDWFMPCRKENIYPTEKGITLEGNYVSVSEHYDMLIDEKNDPLYDSELLKEYMDKSDGQYFINCLDLTPMKDVLEIGVGTGRLAIRVVGKCRTLCGIDISEKTVARAKRNLKEFDCVSLIWGDFLEYPLNIS